MKRHITALILLMLAFFSNAQDNNGRYYSAGEIQSRDEVLYGRFEMMMYSSDMSGTTSTFFMWRNGGQTNTLKWNEIDIETFGRSHNTWQSNPIWQHTDTDPVVRRWEGYHNDIPIANTWVKFAMEWTPDYIAWFNNDVEVRRILRGQNAPQGNDPVGNISNPMRMCFNHWATFPGDWLGPFNPADLPSFQFVDWFTYQPWTGTGFGSVTIRHDFNTRLEVSTAYHISEHTFDDNQCTFRTANVGVVDGMLWLSITGYQNARSPIGDEIPLRPVIHEIPGRIQAEDYSIQYGLELETTNDEGGGQNLGYTTEGDYAEYTINVTETGIYNMDFRIASLNGNAGLSLLVDGNTIIDDLPIASTQGWQIWETLTQSIMLTEGKHTLRFNVLRAGFNLNWMELTKATVTSINQAAKQNLTIYPNPVTNILHLPASLKWEIYSADGKPIAQGEGVTIDMQIFQNGVYFVKTGVDYYKIVKQ